MHPQQPMPYPQQQPYSAYAPMRPPPTNTEAVASLIFSLLWIFGIGSIAAIIFGHYAIREIRRTGERGDGLAKAGLILGYLGAAPMILIFILALIGLIF